MKYRQWKKNYKKLHGVNPPLELDKRKQRRLAKKAIKNISSVDLVGTATRAAEALTNTLASFMRGLGGAFDAAGTACSHYSIRKRGAKMSEKGDDWIYGNPCIEYEELFKRIEAALGFKLFTWQKSFIVMGTFRQYGETTARILRELLDTEAAPLDYTRRDMSHRENFYRQQLREIQERLKDAGIKTRVVFWSIGDKRRYAESYKRNLPTYENGVFGK